MSHFYLPPEAWTTEAQLTLTGEEARHCSQVRRHRVGDRISILDGCGRRARGTIQQLTKNEVSVSVEEVVRSPSPALRLTLLQALPKGDGFEWIIEKSVELGVSEILPVITERTISRLDAKDAEKKHAKWQRQIIEACKQCGQTWMPALLPLQNLSGALKQSTHHDLRLVASLEEDALPIAIQCKAPSDSAVIAIGPEGDFSPNEYSAFRDAGWKPISLGLLTLRCETAAIASVAVVGHHLSTLK